MSTPQAQVSLNYVRVAWQSALAAGLCLGLPAGVSLWLILFQQIHHSAVINRAVTFFQSNGLYRIWVLALASLLWSFLLGRISGYRPWWRIGAASAVAIVAAWFSPLANVDGILYQVRPSLPIHLIYAAAMAGLIAGVTSFVGLGYGIILRGIKVALTMAFGTSFVSVLALLLTIIVFDQFGIRVGTGNFAMSRVTVTSLLASAILGGMVLGVMFTWFAEQEKRRLSIQNF